MTDEKAGHKNEKTIAVIGLVGVLITAAFSNWDKIFPPEGVVTTTYSGYTPSNNRESELRIYYEISGHRDTLLGQQQQIFQQSLIEEGGEVADLLKHPELVETINTVVEDEFVSNYAEILHVLIPIAAKYYSLEEIQSLNKFYSTPEMREMVRKQPLIAAASVGPLLRVKDMSEERLFEKLGPTVEKYMKVNCLYDYEDEAWCEEEWDDEDY